MEFAIGIIGLITSIALIWAIFSLLWGMAEDRGQPPWLWVFLFFAIGPFAFLALWFFFDISEDDQSSDEDWTE